MKFRLKNGELQILLMLIIVALLLVFLLSGYVFHMHLNSQTQVGGKLSKAEISEDSSVPSHNAVWCPALSGGKYSALRPLSRQEELHFKRRNVSIALCEDPVLVRHIPNALNVSALQKKGERTLHKFLLPPPTTLYCPGLLSEISSNVSTLSFQQCVERCISVSVCCIAVAFFKPGHCILLSCDHSVSLQKLVESTVLRPLTEGKVFALEHRRSLIPAAVARKLCVPQLSIVDGLFPIIRVDPEKPVFFQRIAIEIVDEDTLIRCRTSSGTAAIQFSLFPHAVVVPIIGGYGEVPDAPGPERFTLSVGNASEVRISILVNLTVDQKKVTSLSRHLISALHYEADNAWLRYRPIAALQFPQEIFTSLRSTEGLLQGVEIVLVRHTFGSKQVFVPASHEITANEFVRLDVRRTDHYAHCLRLTGGTMSHFEENGVAPFHSLIVEWLVNTSQTCWEAFTTKSLEAYSTINVTLNVRPFNEHLLNWFTVDEAMVPLINIIQAIKITQTERIRRERSEKDSRTRRSQTHRNNGFLLISVTAHESLESVISLATNIRFFAPSTHLVFHFAKNGEIPAGDPNRLLLHISNKSQHQSVFVNPQRFNTAHGLRQVLLHAKNYFFMTTFQQSVQFSHVLCMASNEMLVRHGLENYVRKFDASNPSSPPTRFAGIVYEEFSDVRGRFIPLLFEPPWGTFAKRKDRLWLSIPRDIIFDDHWLYNALHALKIRNYSTFQGYFEGTFLSRPLAEFAFGILNKFFPVTPNDLAETPSAYCEDPMLYPITEVYFTTLFQNLCRMTVVDPYLNRTRPVQCGHRVSTVLWKRPQWTAIVEDVERVRCSPFEVPFAVKRVPRDSESPVRVAIENLMNRLESSSSSHWTNREQNLTMCHYG